MLGTKMLEGIAQTGGFAGAMGGQANGAGGLFNKKGGKFDGRKA
jgi:hypothetical protein